MRQTYKLTLCYDGTNYRGWQKQGNTQRTIQGKLEAALQQLLQQKVEVQGSGRTDAGVHAAGQVASFSADTALSAEEILRRLRALLPEDIGAIALEPAPPRFHARLCATGKVYCYRVWNSASPDVFFRRYETRVPEPLDLAAMREAMSLFLGTHDFRAFCSNTNLKKSSVRTVYEMKLLQQDARLEFWVRGNGFLYNMVRIMVGTLLEVGKGNMPARRISEILQERQRALAGPMAPACGLCMMEVFYE